MESSTRLSVLQICHDYEGPFRAVCRLYADAFEGHHVTTLYVGGKRDASVVADTGGDAVLFLERPTRSMRGIKFVTLFMIAKLFRRQHFDVVIAHRYKPIYFAGIMSFFFSTPVLLAVVHEHGVFRRITRRLFITLWRRNIVCIGVSASVSRDIERWCGPLAGRGRLFTLPHAIDIERAQAVLDRGEARRKLGLPDDRFCFGTVGRLVAKKDHDVLLAAFRQFVARTGQACLLVVIGTGPEAGRLTRYAEDNGMDENVRFVGHIDDAYRYMKAFDVFVFPAGPGEAFGMVLLEAMLSSVPVVCSQAPGPAEVVGDFAVTYVTGDADDLAHKLAQVRQMSAAMLARLGDSGEQKLRHDYTLQAFRRRLADIPDIKRLGVKISR